MFWAIREEAMLHELPLPEVDDPGSVREVRWPAERPWDCADVLLEWLDAGLLAVMVTDTQERLSAARAREVLTDHANWSATYWLTLTDAGESALP